MINFKFKNPLAVTENDTVGSAILKGVTEGYLKATAVGLVGLGTLAYGLRKLNDIAENSEEPEEVKTEEDQEESINDDIQKNWKEIDKIAKKNKAIVDSL